MTVTRTRSIVGAVLATFVLLGEAGAQVANQLKDIYSTVSAGGSHPAQFVLVEGVAYFTASEASNGEELWRTDGTADGTWLVKDIHPGPASSSCERLTRVGGTLFFTATTAGNGREL